MQNHAGPKNMCKKTRKTGGGQSSMGVFSQSHVQLDKRKLTKYPYDV
jgi:hypothetical protein